MTNHPHNVEPHQAQPTRSAYQSSNSKLIITALVLVLVAVGGFVGGMQYQKGKSTSSSLTASTSGAPGAMGSGSGGQSSQMNGSFGSVTKISADSITVSDQRASTSKTYSIDSSTKLTDNGSTVTYSDISVGDRVMVQTGSSSSTTATSIMVNPTMGGGGGPGQGSGGQGMSSQSSGASTTTNTN